LVLLINRDALPVHRQSPIPVATTRKALLTQTGMHNSDAPSYASDL